MYSLLSLVGVAGTYYRLPFVCLVAGESRSCEVVGGGNGGMGFLGFLWHQLPCMVDLVYWFVCASVSLSLSLDLCDSKGQ